MKITAEQYQELLNLFEHIAHDGSDLDDQIRHDVDAVRASIVAEEDGAAEVAGERQVYEALTRLLEGHKSTGQSSSTRALLSNARRFASDAYSILNFRSLYGRSPTLQQMPAQAFETQETLVKALIEQRSTVISELNEGSSRSENVPLITLVHALVAGGRLVEKIQDYGRFAGARDLYDRSPLLQSISDVDLVTPEKVIAKLSSLRSTIVDEQRRIRGIADDKLEDYALGTLVLALEAGGRIVDNIQPYMRLASSRDLYDRSPLLQNISDADLATPEKLVTNLFSLRQDIVAEQRKVRGIGENKLETYALGTLVLALVAGGRLVNNIQTYERRAGSRDFYDRSLLLQSISDADLATPERLVARLSSLKPAIVVEQRRIRGVSEEKLETYALGTLVLALVAGGRIVNNIQTYERLASARDLYDKSLLLQNISNADLATPGRLVARLFSLRSAIVVEQHDIRGVSEEKLETYSLVTLVSALEAGARIAANIQPFKRMAGARDLYDRSFLLQNISDADLATPERLLARLSSLRSAIVAEQRRIRGVSEEKLDTYSLGTLVEALKAGSRIVDNIQPYMRFVSARELYDRSTLLQNISDTDLTTPERLVATLSSLRSAIVAEQRRIRGVSEEKLDTYSLGTFVGALEAGGRIAANIQPFMRLAGARDLYDRSPLLQAISAADLSTRERLVAKLSSLRPAIVAEQRSIRNVSVDKIENYALNTLTEALKAGGRISDDIQPYMRLAGSRDLYDRSSTLRSISSDILQDNESLMEFLLTYRDRVAIENLHAIEELRADDFYSPEAEAHYSLVSLIDALYAGEMIDIKRAAWFRRVFAGPLEYFLQRRNVIEPEIRRIGSGRVRWADVNLSLFTSLKAPTRQLSISYIKNIIRWARWFLDARITVRSIFKADEIALMVLSNFAVAPERMPDNFVRRLVAAGRAVNDNQREAFQEAIDTVKDIRDHYDNLRKEGRSFDSVTTRSLEQIGQLYELEKDVLQPALPSTPIAGGGVGSPSTSLFFLNAAHQQTMQNTMMMGAASAGFGMAPAIMPITQMIPIQMSVPIPMPVVMF